MRKTLKKNLCLLLAILMLSTLVMTSCSNDEEDETTTTLRTATYLTVYAITEKGTTDEAIQLVQDRLNTFTESSLKTSLVLRFYTEDKYQAALDEMHALFNEEKIAKDEADAAAAAAKKEKQAYEKTLSSEELRAIRQQERLAQKEADRIAAQEEKERLERIEMGIEEPPAPITSAQMDIVFINGYDEYLASIKGNELSENKPLLLPLDEYLKRDEKLITDYVNPVILSAAKVNGATYAIPVNKSIGKGAYFVFNKALCEKYELDVSKVKSLYNCEDFLALIKENEPNVIPMVSSVTLNGIDFYKEFGGAIMVSNSDTNLFSAESASSTFKTYSVKSHFERMYNFRSAGYFKESYASSVKDFFLDIREGTLADVAKWEAEGYTVLTYKAPKATAEECCSALFGISYHSKLADRAAEILTLLYTNAAFRTAFTYGVENVHYTLDENGLLTVINDSYKMDFFKTGNALIGNVPEKYLGYREAAIENNLKIKPAGFLTYMTKLSEEDLEKLAQYNKVVEGKYEALCKGVEDWEEQINAIVAELDELGFTAFLSDVFNADYGPAALALVASEAARVVAKPSYVIEDTTEAE